MNLMPLALKVSSPQSFTEFLKECNREIWRSTGDRHLAWQILDSMSAWLEGNRARSFLTNDILANPWTTAAVLIVTGIDCE